MKIRPFHLLLTLYIALALIASLQAWFLTRQAAVETPPAVTKYNNYLLFRSSYDHLLNGENLYKAYPEEHWDLYKYSPTFSLFFGLFSLMPDWLGLVLWNLLNALVLFAGIRLLPGVGEKNKAWLLFLAALDTMTSLHNSQSNTLIAGLLLLGFIFLERRNLFVATLFILLTFYIKLFGIVALAAIFLYPDKVKSMAYAAGWFVLLWVLPAIVTGFGPLVTVYREYFDMLKQDQSASVGISFMGWIQTWFGLGLPKTLTPLLGLALTLLPLAFLRRFADTAERAMFFFALMTWMVIFNHKAESPTFIIASAGIYAWYFYAERSALNITLLILVVIFTSLSATDLFPPFIRKGFFEPYSIKVIPCVLVWGKILFDLLTGKIKA